MIILPTSFPLNGYDFVHDPELAEYYKQKAFKWCDENSSLPDPEIWFDLSKMYEAGIPDLVDEMTADGLWKDVRGERVIYWLRKAANHGLANAQYLLGEAYFSGRKVEEDDEQAAYWYTKSACQGHADAQINLGWRYYGGKGVSKNEAIAVEWFQKAAEQGSAWGQSCLALMYEEGTGVKQDNEQAIRWYRKAAEQGDEGAIRFLIEVLGVDWNTK